MEDSRRGKFEIVLDILRVCRQPTIKTGIVYHANLNFNMIKPYIAKLLKNGLLTAEGKTFKTTEKGKTLLEQGLAIESLIYS